MLIDYEKVNVYQQDKLILQDVSFHADEGEFIYIIGKVGSGKSSLLKTFYCELDVYDDEAEKAEVLGRDLKTLRRKEVPALRKEMGIIFQDFQLLHDRTVYKNLYFVLRATGWKNKADIDQRIDQVLGAVEMSEKKTACPTNCRVANSSVSPSHGPCSTSPRLSSPTSLRVTSTPRQPTTSSGC